MTKEEKSEYNRKYREANKEKLAAKRKVYDKANKEKIAAQEKNKHASKKDGYYTVYYLKEEHYVGMTTNLSYRMRYHKSKHNRKVEDVEIFGKYETKEEAIRTEAELHNLGYLGEHPRDRTRNQQLNNQYENNDH